MAPATPSTPPAPLMKPPKVEDGDFTPGTPLTEEQTQAIIESKGISQSLLKCKSVDLSYGNWVAILNAFTKGERRSVHTIHSYLKTLDDASPGARVKGKYLTERHVGYIVRVGLPHLGLPPVEDFARCNPQIHMMSDEALTESGIGKMCKSPGPTQKDSDTALQSLSEPSMGMAEQASFLPRLQEIAATEASREHLSIQALLEAGIGLNDLLLGQIMSLMRKVEEDVEGAFSSRGKITPGKLQMMADSMEKLSKAQTRLVDASQKMRGERGIDTGQQTASAIGILVANMDSEGLRYFAQKRELPPSALLGQPTSPKEYIPESVIDQPIEAEFVPKEDGIEPSEGGNKDEGNKDEGNGKGELEPEPAKPKRYAVDILEDV